MNEEKKRDLQSVLSAGKKVIAKLKNYRDGKIMAYDGDDCYYSDGPADIYSDDFEITPEGFSDTESMNKERKKAKIQDFVSGITGKKNEYADEFSEESENDAGKSEQAFEYYEKIMGKIDNLKDSIKGNDGINDILKKAENLFKSNSLSKEQLESELDSLMVELDDKLSVLTEKTSGVAKSVDGLTEQSKSNYENLASSIGNISDKTAEMMTTLIEMGSVLKSSEAKVDEIHEASMGIEKLIDSLFELKNSSRQIKNEIEQIKKKQKFIKIWGIIVGSVVGAIAIAALVFQILGLFVF